MADIMGHWALATLEACGSGLFMSDQFCFFSGCPEVPDQSGFGLELPMKLSCLHSTSTAGSQPHLAAGGP